MLRSSMSEGNDLSPEQLRDLELDNVPAIDRQEKIGERRGVFGRLTGPLLSIFNIKGEVIQKPSSINGETGGISSKLDPVNPQHRQFGEPTIPLTVKDIKPTSKDTKSPSTQ